jgi:hypothetical protein
MPILVTPDVAYPYEKTANLPYNDNVPGDWVLKTYPAYDVNKCIPVYPITDTNSIQETIHLLPASNTQIMMIYGTGYRILERAVMQ